MNIELLFAPTYSSEFNPIERLWAIAKKKFTQQLALTHETSIGRIRRLIQESIATSSQRILRDHVNRCMARMYRVLDQSN